MNLIEEWGSGIPKLMKAMHEYSLREPEFIDMGIALRINLYREKTDSDYISIINPREYDTKNDINNINDTKNDTNNTENDTNDTKKNRNEEAILSILQRNPKATQKELCSELGVSIATVKRFTDALQKKGRLHREGSRKGGLWIVVDTRQ